MNDLPSSFLVEEHEFALSASILMVCISFYIFYRNWKRLRIIEDTPTAKLRSAHQGYVELEGNGQLIDDQLIYAPLSSHLCIWYQSQIESRETYIQKGRSQERWNIIYQTRSHQRFKLVDGMHHCLVDPTGAEVQSKEKLVWYGNTPWPTTTKILESQSILNMSSNRYRYQERLILPGQPLYLIGQFSSPDTTTNSSVSDVMRQLIVDWKKDQQQLLKRFDTDKNGEIDQAEWEFARQAAKRQAQQIYHERSFTLPMNLISKPDNSQYPFIISVYPQMLLIKKYRLFAFIAFALNLILISYTAWLIQSTG